MQKRDFPRAVPLLEQLWQQSRAELAAAGDAVESVGDSVLRAAAQLPDDERQRFFARIATDAGDSDPLTRKLPTRAGYLAQRRLAYRLRDRGEVELAVAAWEQLARHPAATKSESLRAEVIAVDLRGAVEGPAAARHWLQSIEPGMRQAPMQIGGEATTVEAWLIQRWPSANAAPVASPALSRPSLTPSWEWTVDVPDALAAGLRAALNDLRAQGLARRRSVTPMVVDGKIVVPTLKGVACLEKASGRVLWQIVDRAANDRATLTTQQQQNPLFSHKLLSSWTQQLQINSLYGSLSHDADTVYHLVEPAAVEPHKPAAGSVLAAIDLATGQRKWHVGSLGKNADPAARVPNWNAAWNDAPDAPGEIFVCGPPLVLGNRLHLLCERKSELVFLAANRETLELEWSCHIGHLLPDVARAAPRTYTAAPMVWTGRWIVCGTNCGAVVALDPLNRSIQWIARFPVELWSVLRPDLSNADIAAAAGLRSWRTAAIWFAGGRLVCASPESPDAQVLDEATGARLGTIPRGNAVGILGVTQEAVVLLEPTGLRARDIATGKESWRTVLGEISGQGVLMNETVVQPLANGSVAVVDLKDGRRLPGAIRSNVTLGNLLEIPDGWLSCDEFHVRTFSDLNSERNRNQLARVDLEAGDFAAVRSKEPEAAILRETDLAELYFDPRRAAEIEQALIANSVTREAQGEAYWALADAYSHEKSWNDAVRCCLEGLAVGLQDEVAISGPSIRRVRRERAFQGLIRAAFRECDESERAELEKLLAARWQAARNALDPFAVQQLEHHWRTLAWTRPRLVDDAESVFLGSNLLSRELALLSAGATELPALWKLCREWQAAAFPQDAEDIARRLLADGPGRAISADATVRQQLEDSGFSLLELQHRLQFGPEDPWPRESPRVTPSKELVEDDALQTVVPLTADADGIWDRVDVSINRTGRVLRFTGDGQQESWTVPIPQSQTSLQEFPLTYQAWGWGRLLVIRVGPQLLALSPWNEQGEPVAKVVWSLNLLGPRFSTQDQLMVERIPAKWKRAQDSFRILDQTGREVIHVGPVRPGYLCYLQHGKLIAVETQTGRQLWERWDVPPGAVPLGDEENVALWSPGTNEYEVLDAADGQTLFTAPMPCTANDVWHEAHGTIWTAKSSDVLTVACRDLLRRTLVWEQTFPKDCVPTALDHRTAAVLDPQGVVYLIALETGELRTEPLTVELPPAIERVLVSRDETHWYLGVSGPVSRSLEWMATQQGIINSYRRPLLEGPLVAIRRASGEIAWKREFGGEPWIVDQNKTTPVLTQVYKLPPPNLGQGIGEGVLKLIDKRTGRDVFTYRDFNLLPYFSLEVRPERQQIEIRTKSIHFQVDYAPEESK